jgi:uncharacterized membrane protein YidH (DUF202 family)
MALGFVVARFGLLIRELAKTAHQRIYTGLGTGFGVALVICGAAFAVMALVRYRDTANAIEQQTYRPSFRLVILLTGGLVLTAALLAAYLLLT